MTLAYFCSYLIIELVNQGELIFYPLLRFIGGWPSRVLHWFSDPLRFGVPLEVGFTALVLWILFRVLAAQFANRLPQKSSKSDHEDDPGDPAKTQHAEA